jgi:hypothetical protein
MACQVHKAISQTQPPHQFLNEAAARLNAIKAPRCIAAICGYSHLFQGREVIRPRLVAGKNQRAVLFAEPCRNALGRLKIRLKGCKVLIWLIAEVVTKGVAS